MEDQQRTVKKATRREVAHRIFSFEIDETTVEERGNEFPGEEATSFSDQSKIPNYVITPTGLRVNRVLLVGKLISMPKQIGEKDMWKFEVRDSLGKVFVLTPNFRSEIVNYVKSIGPNDVPRVIFLTGKIRTYRPDETRFYISIRPEVLCNSTQELHHYWLVQAAKLLLRRLECLEELAKMEPESIENLMAIGFTRSEAEAAFRAKKYYGIDIERIARYREKAVEALRIVMGEEVEETPEESRGAESEFEAEISELEAEVGDEERTLYEMIKSYKREGVVMDELVELTGMEPEKIEDIALSLIEKGLVDEPEPSRYRAVGSEEEDEEEF
ncbi:MAG: hypothetical protein N3F63_00695 [Thermoplasmata archaeon]|nr:hypothetical protein [Thermoplasmata archaeon]